MTALATYDDIVARIAAGFWMHEPIYGNKPACNFDMVANNGWNQTNNRLFIVGHTNGLPTLPAGVTAYLIPEVSFTLSPNRPVLIAELINLGSIDISGASGTFTDGSAFPTETELGTSVVKWGMVLMEVTVNLVAVPGSLTITYDDQGGVSSSTGALALPASATVGTCGPMTLAAGDWGVRDITAVSRTGGTTPTGTVKFWGVIPIVQTGIPSGGCAVSENLLVNSFNPRRLGASSVIGMIQLGATSVQGAMMGMAYIVGDS